MKYTFKFFFISFLVIFALSFYSCTSSDFDTFEEKIDYIFDFERIFGSKSEDKNISKKSESSQKSTTKSETKISSFQYAVPKDFEKAYSFRTDLPESIAKKIPADIKALKTSNPASYVQKCCEFISANSSDDFEKIKIAHDIVALNTKYDAKSFWSGNLPSQDYATVLKTGLAVCEGYSNLLKKLLDSLGFQNLIIHGYARGVGVSLLDEKNIVSNHAWNLVKIENEYYFIDSTWDSGYMNGKSSVQRYTTDWLFIKPEHFIYSHFPEKQNQQLLKNPLSNSEFLALADLRPKFFEAAENFKIGTSRNSQNETQSYEFSQDKFVGKQTEAWNSVRLEYNLQKDYSLSFVITQIQTKSQKNNLDFTESKDDKTLTTIQFPAAELYRIQVFYYGKNSRQGWSCAEFFVNAESSSDILYPQIYNNSFESKIITPIKTPLKKGETYHFEISCPSKKFVAIINGRNFVQMQKSENGNFVLDFEIPSNVSSLNIASSNVERGSYQTIAPYLCK